MTLPRTPFARFVDFAKRVGAAIALILIAAGMMLADWFTSCIGVM